MNKKNLKILLCYDGSSFYGWQKTARLPSIEEELEKALFTILQKNVSLQAASRTDAGVHAMGQVVNFMTELSICLKKLQTSLNQILPPEIKILSIEEMPLSFHPTIDAIAKEYHYQVSTSSFLHPFKRHTHWHYPKKLNFSLMQEATFYLLGTKDFESLTNFRKPSHKNTICTIEKIEIVETNEDFVFKVKGDHFLYKMMRNMAGLLCYVGSKKISLSQVPLILERKTRNNPTMTAPAHGLILQKVFFKSLEEKPSRLLNLNEL